MGKSGARGRRRNRAKRPSAGLRTLVQRHNPTANRQRMKNDPPPLKAQGFENFKVQFLVTTGTTAKVDSYGILTDPGTLTLLGTGVQHFISLADVRKAILAQKLGLSITSAMTFDLNIETACFWGKDDASMVEMQRSAPPNLTFPALYVRDTGAKNSKAKCKLTWPATYWPRSISTGGTEGILGVGIVAPTTNPASITGMGSLTISGTLRKVTSVAGTEGVPNIEAAQAASSQGNSG